MKHLVLLSLVFVLLGCKSNSVASGPSEDLRQVQNPAGVPQVSADVPLEFLLTSAATDFQKHTAPAGIRFRHIRIAYDMTPEGKKMYMLCGQFQPPQKKEESDWTPFVTIQTSGYEQYIGDTNYCQKPSVKWEEGDFSAALQSRFDSTR